MFKPLPPPPYTKDLLNNGTCVFMDGSKRAPVALVSFPGSGNTWARGLLESATGICTGEGGREGGRDMHR